MYVPSVAKEVYVAYDPYAVRANTMELPKYSPLDLFQALERQQKAKDQEDNLESILTATSLCLEEDGNLDIGGGVKVYTLETSKESVGVYLKDPEGTIRYYQCAKSKLLGSKDFTEVLVRMIKG